MNSNKKQKIAWYFYDFACSAFSTTVVTVFLGPYLTGLAEANAVDNSLTIFGFWKMNPGSFFPYTVTLSVLLQIFIMPFIGAITDYTSKKKTYLAYLAFAGALSTILFYFLESNTLLLGALLFIIANVAYGSAIVVNNSILNDISEEKDRDKDSSRGFAFGYVGGGILLALNLVLFANSGDNSYIDKGMAVRISLASAGAWWAIFTLFPLFWLKLPKREKEIPQNSNILTISFKQLKHTLKDAKNHPLTLTFLIAFLFYNDGVQTVITFASQFGTQELGLSISTLTTVILMVQFVAFFGAFFFEWLAQKIGAKNTILITLLVWTSALFYAYGPLKDEAGFYLLGLTIGLVMPGTQALSRSLFSRLIPSGKEAEYFSLYEVSERGTSWMGPFLFGLSLDYTGSYRFAILSLILFFIIGGGILLFFREQKIKKLTIKNVE